MDKPNSTVILNCRSRMVNKYLAKLFYVIENDSKQLSMLTNDVKLRINVIDQLDTDFVMKNNTEISSVVNTIKKLHIQKNIYSIYKQEFYKDKKK